MNFTNEEIILENEIKRKDTIQLLSHKNDDYFETVLATITKFLGMNMLVVTNKEEKKVI